MEIRGEPVSENNNEEIERVERPSQKGCRYRVSLTKGRKEGYAAVAALLNNGTRHSIRGHTLRNIAIYKGGKNRGHCHQQPIPRAAIRPLKNLPILNREAYILRVQPNLGRTAWHRADGLAGQKRSDRRSACSHRSAWG